MSTKVDTYKQMADRATQSLTAGVRDWSRFLIRAGQLYKYNFPDQVMIYTQRPTATACAEIGLWSHRMGRRIRRGARGIALLWFHGGRTSLRYVFDVADTERLADSRDPMPWVYREEYQAAVISRLDEYFHVPGGDGLDKHLIRLAVKFSEDRWHDFKRDFMYSIRGSLLEELDEDNLAVRFRSAMTVSLAFLLLSRCGFDLDSYFSPEDFDCIREFNTRDVILALGNSVNEGASLILQQIERAIRKYEHGKTAGALPSAAPPKDVPPSPLIGITETDDPPQTHSPKGMPSSRIEIPKPQNSDTGAAAGESKPAAAPVPFSGPNSSTEPKPPTPEHPALRGRETVPALPLKPAADAHNFRITDDHLGEGGPKAKYQMNTGAIRALKQIEAEGRSATPAEQEILSRYVGWGGVPDAFDPDRPEWAAEYAELKSLLTEEEYAAARASTLNAHYTSPTVIRAIYEAVGSMGFTSGNVLEPSCGVGNFFGLLPESMAASRLYGVELDPITGRIAKLLYPGANIAVRGYEESSFPNDFFDIAVGNVPFGQYQVNDPAYNRYGFSIHNYFLCKALDQLRPGGIMAFVTSRYTMDSKDSAARKYLAGRADLLGAIRLPNNAFRANAGTDIVSDILFFQKRDEPRTALPDWVSTQENQDGYPVNSYFMDNPEMVLGCPGSESTRYGRDYTVSPTPGADLSEQLREAVARIHGAYRGAAVTELDEEDIDSIPADPDVKNYSFTVVNGKVYYRENSVMVCPKLSAAATARVTGMVGLRDCVQRLIALQMEEGITDSTIRDQQVELNRLYDAFTCAYGLINSRANRLAFSSDSSYYLLCSLEVLDDDGRLERKADIFTMRTINRRVPVTHADTAQDALAVSIGERARVDLPYMAQLTRKTEQELTVDLCGTIYKDPITSAWQTADEYLSGNVRRKLREAQRAAETDPSFQPNVEALLAAQPRDLEAGEIEVRLGATWIAPEYIQQFMHETFQTPVYQRKNTCVVFAKATAAWFITNKSWVSSRDIAARTTYGTDRYNAYEILEETLNLRDVRVYDTVKDPDGKERRVLNSKQTTLAAQKQQAIRDAFKDWIWKDPERRQTLVQQYNEEMNCIRPREYDGSHIVFHGINPSIQLRPHQLGAIAHVLYGGNTLLAHEVGAGKSFEMIAAAMESKYLGLCSKSIFVVPNHLTQQMAAEFLRLYPAANILVTTKRDFETARRKKFCARIATGDWDAVIIGHSQFEKIPISFGRQEQIIEEQIDDITEAISEVKASKGERFTIKQMEKLKKDLLARLEKLRADWKKDSVISFEQLGVDRMFVDESDAYKNLFLYTKMRNVAGLSTAEAQKSSDMFAKCRYMDEITHGRGIIMATGTPISNSMTEFFTVQRYLQYGRLQEMGMGTFDSWASRFGETVTALELDPAGTGYRARTRFAKFFNLPELMAMFKEVADIKTADQLDLPTPEVEYHTVVSQPTEHQKALVKELSRRAELVHSGAVDARSDNMLKITSDGRKLGLDQRVINPALPDEPGTKINMCVANILRHWREGEADKLTQLVFCDLSTPTAGKGGFNIYDDIRAKLIAGGMPPEQIAFIHEANSDEQKKALFAKVRSGQVRVLIGSTQKMGAGTNVQDRLIASHDLDCPWRPRDLTQRAGRIVRQGNMNPKVHIYRYVTESTFDSYLWQTVEAKQKFISQIMTSRTPLRSCEDVDETVLSFAEIKALCAGDPRIKERMELDVDVARLRIMKTDYQSKKFRLEDDILKRFPSEISRNEAIIAGIRADMQTLAAHPHPKDGFAGMTIHGHTYTEKGEAGGALLDAVSKVTQMEPAEIGAYRGLTVTAALAMFGEHKVTFKGVVAYTVELGGSATGNITRIDNALARLPEQLEETQARLADLKRQMESAKIEAAKPFTMEAELREKSARLAELDAALNLGGRTGIERPAA